MTHGTRTAAATLLIFACLAPPPLLSQEEGGSPPARSESSAGITIVATAVGSAIKPDDLMAFLEVSRFRHVAIDWVAIGDTWPKSDFESIDRLVRRMKEMGIEVSAMYRPRFHKSNEPDPRVPFQVREDGEPADDTREICFSSAESRAWGAQWSAEILKKCPSFDRVTLYNPRNHCRCETCRTALEKNPEHTVESVRLFLSESREAMRKVNPDAKLGVVFLPQPAWYEKMKDAVDFSAPFLFVRGDVDYDADMRQVRQILGKTASPACAQITWGDEIGVTDDQLAAFVVMARERGISYWFWTFDTVFLSGLYDVDRLCGVLKIDAVKTKPILARMGARLTRTPPPLSIPAPPPLPYVDSLPWAPTLEEALAQARKTNRIVAAFVFPVDSVLFESGYEGSDKVARTWPRNESVQSVRDRESGYVKEKAVLTALLCDPHLASLVSRRFVPVRLRLVTEHFVAKGESRLEDPLTRLGTTCRSARAPSLVFASPDGKLLHQVSSMGVFSPVQIHKLCRALLDRHAEWNGPDAEVERAEAELVANPKDLTCHHRLVDVLIESGDFSGARKCINSMPDYVPDKQHPAEVQMLMLEGAFENALTMHRSTSSRDFLGDVLRVEILMRLGRFQEALQVLNPEYSASTCTRPLLDRAQYYLACAYDRTGDRARAEELWTEVSRSDPDGPWAARALLRLSPRGPFLEEWEAEEPLPSDPLLDRTEAGPRSPDPVLSAIDLVLDQQRPDGGWRDPHYGPHPLSAAGGRYDMTVPRTALCVEMLQRYLPRLDGTRAKRAEEAIRKGVERVNRWSEDPQDYVWHLTYALQLELRLHERLEGDGKSACAARIAKILKGIERIEVDGGWSYTSDKFRLHSFNTAPILIGLVEAKRQGLKVDEAMMERAAMFLEGRRLGKGSIFHYGTKMEHLTPPYGSSATRSALCELALYLAGARKDKSKFEESLDLFFENIDEVRQTAKIYEMYFDRTIFHDAYHYYFGCCYAARVIHLLDDGEKRRALAKRLTEKILSTQEVDGSFVDAMMQGKSYSTAMALLALDELYRAERKMDGR